MNTLYRLQNAKSQFKFDPTGETSITKRDGFSYGIALCAEFFGTLLLCYAIVACRGTLSGGAPVGGLAGVALVHGISLADALCVLTRFWAANNSSQRLRFPPLPPPLVPTPAAT